MKKHMWLWLIALAVVAYVIYKQLAPAHGVTTVTDASGEMTVLAY